MPDARYMNFQDELTWDVRSELVRSLVRIHNAFPQLSPASLFLAVNLLDRYCSLKKVKWYQYRLVGCTALLLAAKFVDKSKDVPRWDSLCAGCGWAYKPSEFVRMEWEMLITLDWDIGRCDAYTFTQMRIARTAGGTPHLHMTTYIAEIALFYGDFVDTKPSVLSFAAQTLADVVINCLSFDVCVELSCWRTIYDLLCRLAHPPEALLDKYASRNMSRVPHTVYLFCQRKSNDYVAHRQ